MEYLSHVVKGDSYRYTLNVLLRKAHITLSIIRSMLSLLRNFSFMH